VGANVITMEGDRVLRDQTVIVTDGRISALGGAANTQVPANATRVDARGKFLVPGIAEMHAHIPSTVGQLGPQFSEDVLFLYIAAGATTIRGMQGHPSQLELKQRVESGALIGPRMWLAAPQLSGNNANSAGAAERLVRDAKTAGYDLLKVQEGVSQEAYAAIARMAREVGLPWGGHVPNDVGVAGALRERQTTIDHIDDYFVAAQRDGVTEPSAATIDESKIPRLATATRDAGVAIVPTQSLWETLRGVHPAEQLMARPELRYMPRAMIESWNQRVVDTRASANLDEARAHVAFRDRMLKAMSDAGVTILLGTDAPQVFSVPGFSLFHEMRDMVEAGMTPLQVLHSGTVAVARHLGVAGEAGTIAIGKRADLILLDANPLEDIANMEKRSGVIVNGRWLSRAVIDRTLDEIAARWGG
jgi:imidazolonepropionase-like amidohydrolase